MSAPYIDFLGVAGCGKSTLAQYLVKQRSYATRKDLHKTVFGKTPIKQINYRWQEIQAKRFANTNPALQQEIRLVQQNSRYSDFLDERMRQWIWTDLLLRRKGVDIAQQTILFDEGILQRIAGFYATYMSDRLEESLPLWFQHIVAPSLTLFITVELETSLARIQQRQSTPIHFERHTPAELQATLAHQLQLSNLLYAEAQSRGWHCVTFDNTSQFDETRFNCLIGEFLN